MNPNLTKFYCSNPDCKNELGEIACGSQLDDGSYCSSECADLGKEGKGGHIKFLEDENKRLDKRLLDVLKELDSNRRNYYKYKQAYETLVESLLSRGNR